MMISSDSYFSSSGSSTYVVYSIPVLKGDFVRLTASDDDAHTLRYGFATSVAASATVWSLVDQTVDSVDVLLAAPFDGYFVVYHHSSYFSDMLIAKRVMTTDGAVSHGTKTLLDGLAFMLGVSDYEKVNPFWLIGKFQYYNSNSTANSASLARTGKIPVNGRKWIYCTQYMSTGTGSSGIRFFNAEDGGIMGYRIVINSPAAGLRRVLMEVPDGASYFIATCSQSLLGNWFAYIFDDDRLAELIRIADNRKHIKVCLLGNSYTADGWRYVPTMLLQYGITMESFFYYRGSGSLYDLDTQWTDTGSTGISDLDGGQHARITFYVNSENDPVWREWVWPPGWILRFLCPNLIQSTQIFRPERLCKSEKIHYHYACNDYGKKAKSFHKNPVKFDCWFTKALSTLKRMKPASYSSTLEYCTINPSICFVLILDG